MRILVAPDAFAGTLSAPQAAAAIAEGWRRTAPDDEVLAVPVADGGPGFVDVLHAGLGGRLLAVTARGPLREPVPATVLTVGDTAYVESAQACGLALLATGAAGRPEPGQAEQATTFGVGELIAAAVEAGARRVVVGLGGSGTNDGGAGMLAALGATSTPAGALTGGPRAMTALEAVDLAPARAAVAGVELVAAYDVTNPLLGLRGATNGFGPQKGIVGDEAKLACEAGLATFADLVDRRLADSTGAGAAGGLGYGLLALGSAAAPGFATVADALGLAALARSVDLVVTGEGKLDWQSLQGKVVVGIAGVAAAALRPCVVLAGVVEMGNRELRANGIEAAYSMTELVGSEQAVRHPAGSLAALAARVARTWGRR